MHPGAMRPPALTDSRHAGQDVLVDAATGTPFPAAWATPWSNLTDTRSNRPKTCSTCSPVSASAGSLMGVALVGAPEERERVRARLGDAIDVAGEFATLAEAHAAEMDVDALLVAPDRPSENRALVEPLTAREIQVMERQALRRGLIAL